MMTLPLDILVNNPSKIVRGKMSVNLGGFDIGMTKQPANNKQTHTGLDEMTSKSMPEVMDRRVRDPSLTHSRLESFEQYITPVPVILQHGEDIALQVLVAFQQLADTACDWHTPVGLAFCGEALFIANMNQTTPEINIRPFEERRFIPSEPGRCQKIKDIPAIIFRLLKHSMKLFNRKPARMPLRDRQPLDMASDSLSDITVLDRKIHHPCKMSNFPIDCFRFPTSIEPPALILFDHWRGDRFEFQIIVILFIQQKPSEMCEIPLVPSDRQRLQVRFDIGSILPDKLLPGSVLVLRIPLEQLESELGPVLFRLDFICHTERFAYKEDPIKERDRGIITLLQEDVYEVLKKAKWKVEVE